MTIENLMMILRTHEWELGIILIIAGSIKIPTYEIRLIPFILKKGLKIFGNTINEDILKRVDKLEVEFKDYTFEMQTEFRDYVQKTEEEKTDRARSRILRFNDEIMIGEKHSKEHYDEILKDIDKYENYCEINPNYENNRAELAIQIIKNEYAERLKYHNFLEYHK